MKVLLIVVTVVLLAPPPTSVRAAFWNISRNGWLQLGAMQSYVCGLSAGHYLGNRTRGIPWFCVESASCVPDATVIPQVIPHSRPQYDCDSLRYNEHRDKCCYIDVIQPRLDVDPDDHSTYILNVGETRERYGLASFREYKDFLSGTYEEDTREKTAVLRENVVCGLVPAGKKDKTTLYVPYLCVAASVCTDKFNISTPLRFKHGDHFCHREKVTYRTPSRVCCHMSALVSISDPGETWAYKELPSGQTYAVGFKSSFMCEQYNRLVCEGGRDRCPLRILDRHTAVPGEFPHQALVGVTSDRIQFFHCAGSLVSRRFVLSAFDCRIFDGIKANVALLGDYQLDAYGEAFSKERITYIDGQFLDRERHHLLLLRLWRPVPLSYLLRPICLDWVPTFDFSTKISARNYNFGEGWITGYGPVGELDPFNATVKRYRFRFSDRRQLSECVQAVSESKRVRGFNLLDSESHICLAKGSRYSPTLGRGQDPDSGPGYFDTGAPFSVLKYYCQWNLYGISIKDPRSTSRTPALVETLQGQHTFEELESTIWNEEEFNLLEFNMSMPDCADKDNYNFYGMKYLSRSYNKFYDY